MHIAWLCFVALRLMEWLLLLATLPLVVNLTLLTVASLLPSRQDSGRPFGNSALAVVVPAHNEEALIGRCVASLSAQGSTVPIYVVAHNCKDRTADHARQAGAHVLTLNDPGQRGKACALRYGFRHALQQGANAVVVVDADSVVSENFLGTMQSGLDAYPAVQCLYKVLPTSPDAAPGLTAIAFQGFNIVRPRGRERLGLSVGIFGNGFGMRRETLESVPYHADSVVEDLEYHIQLVNAGKRVTLLEDATVFGEMPSSKTGSESQRARWEGGRLLMMRQFPARLLRGIFHGQLRLLEPLLDVLSLPLAMGALCLLVLVFVPGLRWYGAFGLLALTLHFLVALKAGPHFWRGVAVLLRVPQYVLWKLVLLPKIILSSKRNASWVRTERDEEADFSSRPPADALE